MIYRRDKYSNRKVKHVNFLLKQICEVNGYCFIVIVTLESETYGKMVYILLESGKTMLAENFIYFLNNSHGLSPHDYFLEGP